MVRDYLNESISPAVNTYRRDSWAPGTYSTSNGSCLLKRQFRSDVSSGVFINPRLRKPTPYSACRITVGRRYYSGCRCSTSGIEYEYSGLSRTSEIGASVFGPYSNSTYPAPNVPLSLQSECANGVRNRAKNSQFDFGVFLAELHKAGDEIASTAMQLALAFKAFKQRDVRLFVKALGLNSTRQLPKWSSSLWLRYSYAWKPMMQDLYNLAEATRKEWSKYPPLVTSSWRGREPFAPPSSWKYTFTGDVFVGMESKVWFQVSSVWLYGLNSVGLLNPASIIWELVPYSFVFDWLIPVGDFLSALTATAGTSFVTGYETSFANGTGQWTYVPDNRAYVSGDKPVLDVTYTGMHRRVLTSWPYPSVWISSHILSTPRVISAIALLIQRQ